MPVNANKEKKTRSFIHEFFYESGGRQQCMNCERSYGNKTSTSALHEHMQKRHLTEYQKKQKSVEEERKKGEHFFLELCDSDKRKKGRYLLIRAIASSGITTKIVDNIGFTEFINYIKENPDFKLPSGKTMSRELDIFSNKLEKHLIDLLKNKKIVLCSDGWSTVNNEKHVYCMIACFLDDNKKRQSIVLDLFEVKNPQTAANIQDAFLLSLKDLEHRYDVKLIDNVVGFITDGGANIIRAVKNCDFESYRCAAHMIQLVAASVCKTPVLGQAIDKAKSIIRVFHRKPLIRQQFEEEVKRKGMPSRKIRAFPNTRWLYALYLISDVIYFQDVLETIPELIRYRMTEVEKTNAKFFVEKGKLLEEAILDFERSSSYAANCLSTFDILLSSFKDSKEYHDQDSDSHEIAKCFVQETEKRYDVVKDSKMHVVSSFFDARTVFNNEDFSINWDQVVTKAIDEFDSWSHILDSEEDKESDDTEEETPEKRRRNSGSPDEPCSSFDSNSSCSSSSTVVKAGGLWSKLKKASNNINQSDPKSLKQQIEEEVRRYRSIIDENRPSIDSDILQFWSSMEFLVPKLYKFSSIFLILPASSADAERLFSRSGCLLSNKRRSKMSVKKLKNWLMTSQTIDVERSPSSNEENELFSESIIGTIDELLKMVDT